MMKKIYFILLIIGLLSNSFFAQNSNKRTSPRASSLLIRGTVKEDKTLKPISNVEIQIEGGKVFYTDNLGDFRIRARVGDEITISHDSFSTIYYTVKNGERIDVKVQDNPVLESKNKKKLAAQYGAYLSSARNSLKKDAATSIDYVTRALETIEEDDVFGDEKKAELFETLADIYDYWEQPDLAESNYLTSLNNKYNADVKIKLGYAQLKSKKYISSLKTFTELEKSRLSTMQRLKVYQALGDGYRGQNDQLNAIKNYNTALSLAQKSKNEDIIIELNSKLAEVFQKQGNLDDAEQHIDNSVALANRRSIQSSARQRAKAADFYNKNNSYDKEIQLRKEALEDIEHIEEEIALSPSSVSYTHLTLPTILLV